MIQIFNLAGLKKPALLCVSFLFGLGQICFGQSGAPTEKPLLGFARETSIQQRTLEKTFDSLLKRDNLRDWMKRLTARPHHLGSAYDKENAEFIAAQFRAWGY